jgi:biofilm PGA synthesis N-glycosyltransferase PgaC
MTVVADILIAFVGLYPLVSAAMWIAGGVMFHALDERRPPPEAGDSGAAPVSVLIPAFNEEVVIGEAVRAALRLDYPDFEVLVLDDGCTDETAARAREAGEGDPRLRVLRDPTNRGKAERLNSGSRQARGDYLLVIDADAQVHPRALRVLVGRLEASPGTAAVAGDPRVTNRGSLLAALQTLEFSAVIGLIRRTQALSGSVGVIAGIIGLFRREAMLGVGGYDGRMATEDIELTYRLLLAGWETAYEPRGMVGMRVPTSLRVLWKQRRRWARGQGEVIHTHARTLVRWRNRHLWPILAETLASLAWVTLAVVVIVLTVLTYSDGHSPGILQFVPAWGVAVGVINTIQFGLALVLEHRYDREASRALLIGPLYPAAYWLVNALAALSAEIPAVVRGPRGQRVQWDTTRRVAATNEPRP